jgi:hypothetical protein
MKQSIEADLPSVEGRTVATTQELRHLKKGPRLTSGKRNCVEKGSYGLSGPQPEGEVETEASGKAALDRADIPTWPRTDPEIPGRPPKRPHKGKVDQD